MTAPNNGSLNTHTLGNLTRSFALAKKGRTDFNDLLVDSVDETISEVLGARVTRAFWYHYQAFLGITREEMPYRLDTLFASLKGTFGVGGETLGRMIVKKLYAKVNVPLELKPNHSLAEYVEELKQILAQDLMISTDPKGESRVDSEKEHEA